MIYFRHDCNASDDIFIASLYEKFGHKGYAFWFLLVELMTNKMSTFGEQEVNIHWTTVRRKLKTTQPIAEEFLTFCQTNGQLTFTKCSTSVQLFSPNISKLIGKIDVREDNKRKTKENITVYKNREDQSTNLEEVNLKTNTKTGTGHTDCVPESSENNLSLSHLPSRFSDLTEEQKKFKFDEDGEIDLNCDFSPVSYLMSVFDIKKEKCDSEFRRITSKIKKEITEEGKPTKGYSILTYVNFMKQFYKPRSTL